MHLSVAAGETVWVLVCGALVVLMTAGLAFFYGGHVRTENASSAIMFCLSSLAIVTIVWVVLGHTLAFGPDVGKAIGHGGWIGGLDFLGFRDVGKDVSGIAFFELAIVGFAAAVVSRAYVEHMRFAAHVAFVVAWVIVVYAPIAHWIWGDGLLGPRGLGALDFAGGAVVHLTSGAAALAAVIAVGPRDERRVDTNVSFVLLGAGLLWVGWLGFDAGHAAGSAAPFAVINTHVAAAAGLCAWLLVDRMQHGIVTSVGAAKGALTGMVAITPAAGFVRPGAAIAIGAVAGIVCPFAVELKSRFRYDDALDVFAIFWFGGLVGMILTGVFAQRVGLVYSSAFTQVGKQAIASLVTTVWSFALSYVILKVVDWTIGLRIAVDGRDVVGGEA